MVFLVQCLIKYGYFLVVVVIKPWREIFINYLVFHVGYLKEGLVNDAYP